MLISDVSVYRNFIFYRVIDSRILKLRSRFELKLEYSESGSRSIDQKFFKNFKNLF